MESKLLKPRNCACFNVRRAARKITQAYDLALKPAGMTGSQFTLLAMLQGNDEGNGVPLSVLARHLGMDRTTLSRNLAPCERSGWVELLSGEDRRERRIALTSVGRLKVDEALPHWEGVQKRVLKRLGGSELARIISLADRL